MPESQKKRKTVPIFRPSAEALEIASELRRRDDSLARAVAMVVEQSSVTKQANEWQSEEILENGEKLDAVETQTTLTNGRVKFIESHNLPELKVKVDTTWKWVDRFVGAWKIITFVWIPIGIVTGLFAASLIGKIVDKIIP